MVLSQARRLHLFGALLAGLGAFHCAEIPYEFVLPDPQYQLSCSVEGAVCYTYSCCDTPGDTQLSQQLLKYLANFAATGDPQAGAREPPTVAWPAWTEAEERFISFGDPVDRSAAITAGARMLGAARDFWLDEHAIEQGAACHDGRMPGCGGAGRPALDPCPSGEWLSCSETLELGSLAVVRCGGAAAGATPAAPTGEDTQSGGPRFHEIPADPADEQYTQTSNTWVLFILCAAVGIAAGSAMGKLPGQATLPLAGSDDPATDTLKQPMYRGASSTSATNMGTESIPGSSKDPVFHDGEL